MMIEAEKMGRRIKINNNETVKNEPEKLKHANTDSETDDEMFEDLGTDTD